MIPTGTQVTLAVKLHSALFSSLTVAVVVAQEGLPVLAGLPGHRLSVLHILVVLLVQVLHQTEVLVLGLLLTLVVAVAQVGRPLQEQVVPVGLVPHIHQQSPHLQH
jgi:hypothetical protein